MPLWLHCIVILKLKVEPYWTLITLKHSKFKEEKKKGNGKKKEFPPSPHPSRDRT